MSTPVLPASVDADVLNAFLTHLVDEAAQKVAETSKPLPILYTSQDVADACGVSLSTVRRWRHRGVGPRYIQLSPSDLRYLATDLEAWLETITVGGARQP